MNKIYSRRDIIKWGILAGVAAGLKVSPVNAQTPPPLPDIYLQKYPFSLPPLGYSFEALVPMIDAETMRIHYELHHGAYVKNLNDAVASDPLLQQKTLGNILSRLDEVPGPIRAKIRNNGGGHLNHSLFWPSMKKGARWNPRGEFAQKATSSFGSKEEFLKQFAASAMSVFGSGWAWVIDNPETGKLTLETSANQDSPWMRGVKPLLGIDVWEHAYYLKYQNRRADYVKAFEQIIDWQTVEHRFNQESKV